MSKKYKIWGTKGKSVILQKADESPFKISGEWGGIPGYMLASEPPQYNIKPLGIKLESTTDMSKSAFQGPGIFIDARDEVGLNMSLPVTRLSTSGNSFGELILSGKTKIITPDDHLDLLYSPVNPGQFRLDVSSRETNVVGKASYVAINGQDVRSRFIETWPWWFQAIFTGLMGMLVGFMIDNVKKTILAQQIDPPEPTP